jgi:hypothetical protein
MTVHTGLQRSPGGGQVTGQAARHPLRRRALAAGAYLLAGAVLFTAYLRLADTGPANSDIANVLLMASDMLHGNVLLHGWHTSDVSFYTTELPQYALLETFLGLKMETAHVAAAMTYTLAVLLTVLLARGGVPGRRALIRTLIVAGIMLAPQLAGVLPLIGTVGHIGTSVPLLVIWLLLDRAGRRWWVPPLVSVLLAWALVADSLVLIAAVVPLGLVAAVAALKDLVRRRVDWFEPGLVAAAVVSVGLAAAAERVLRALGGYTEAPLQVRLRPLDQLGASVRLTARQVLELFGAGFGGLHGVQFWFAVLHLVSMVLVVAAIVLVIWRFFGRATLVDRVLVVAIVAVVSA